MSFRMLVLGLLLQNSVATGVGTGEWTLLADLTHINGDPGLLLTSLEYTSTTDAVGTFVNTTESVHAQQSYKVGFTNDGGKTWTLVDDASTCTNSYSCSPVSDECWSICVPLETVALDSGKKVAVGGVALYLDFYHDPCDLELDMFFGHGTASKYVDNVKAGVGGNTELMRADTTGTGVKLYAAEEDWVAGHTSLDSSMDGGATWKQGSPFPVFQEAWLSGGYADFDLRHDVWYMVSTEAKVPTASPSLQKLRGNTRGGNIEDTVRKLHAAGASKKQVMKEVAQAARTFRRTRLEEKEDYEVLVEAGIPVRDVVYRSVDFGQTWKECYSEEGHFQEFPEIRCASANVCFLLTDLGISKTSDAGKTWELVWTPGTAPWFWSMGVVSEHEIRFIFSNSSISNGEFAVLKQDLKEDQAWTLTRVSAPKHAPDNIFDKLHLYETYLLRDGRSIMMMETDITTDNNIEPSWYAYVYSPSATGGSSGAL